jgi:flavoprotein
MKVDEPSVIETTLKMQLVISTILMTPAVYIAAKMCLPSQYIFPPDYSDKNLRTD